ANREARELAADALEQLGYQSESATARNAYLQGAFELRYGTPRLPGGGAAPDMIRSLPLDMYFDFMAVRLSADKAAGQRIVLNWRFTDTDQEYILNLENSALTFVADAQADNADATLTLTRVTLDEISLQKTSFADALRSGRIEVTGDAAKLTELLDMLDTFAPDFPVIEPRPPR
ncbi:MAG TPA: alkyl sulfatase C-terminal domain-containing protein, partial [Candidatus Binataceae bacterium]|nr:alkyl sulfatase C-terminal domain-containing protein [Candidatus Binataceae bacterium]